MFIVKAVYLCIESHIPKSSSSHDMAAVGCYKNPRAAQGIKVISYLKVIIKVWALIV